MNKIYHLTQFEFCNLRCVLVCYCCNELLNIVALHGTIYYLRSVGLMSGGRGYFSLLWVSQGQSGDVNGAIFFSFLSISLGENPISGSLRLLPNSVPCGCRSEVPAFLLIVNLKCHLYSLACGSVLHLQIQYWWVESFLHLISDLMSLALFFGISDSSHIHFTAIKGASY